MIWAAAVFGATARHLPPTPDVVQTPRAGLTITHRVGLPAQDRLSPGDPANTPAQQGRACLDDW